VRPGRSGGHTAPSRLPGYTGGHPSAARAGVRLRRKGVLNGGDEEDAQGLLMRHRMVIIFGVLALVLSGLFPPWIYTFNPPGARSTENPAGYHLIFDPPPRARKNKLAGVQIDYMRLLIQWAMIGAIVAGTMAFRRKD